MRMRTADLTHLDLSRGVGLGGLTLMVVAVVLALTFNEPRWYALVAVGGGILAGAVYITYRRRKGPLDWDQHLDDRVDSNFHHL